MFLRKSPIPLLPILLFLQISATAQKASMLARGNPEAAGISSKNITAFLDAANKSKTEFHSFMLLRHGKVIAEGWWNPYGANLEHTLYSCSKSFTATAIGFAIDEKKLSLDDKVVSFFPNDLPDTVSIWLAGLTVKEVLMMSDGQDPDPTATVPAIDSNWIRGFLATPIVHEPGTQFLYNSLGTYMLSAIVQKVTGQKTLDYLKPRLFDPLGIHGMDWETDTKEINTGGWGLRLKTEDMAKFAELFLQQGKWNGKQILPAWWVKEASTVKIMQDPKAPQSKKIQVTGCRDIATRCGDAGTMP
ncbi:MAG: serine hydrolase, partial [Ginsengibacter sp.]